VNTLCRKELGKKNIKLFVFFCLEIDAECKLEEIAETENLRQAVFGHGVCANL